MNEGRNTITDLPVINAFWVGSHLGSMHVACLRSFVRAGHTVVLHTFDTPPVDTPKGIRLADASRLMSADRIAQHAKTGSLSPAADIFRFELLAAGLGVWVDCDCYCIRPLHDAEYLFGWESDTRIGTAVLKLPPASPVLEEMRRIARVTGYIPPWFSRRRRLRYWIRAALGMEISLAHMPWGTMGPTGFTYFISKHGLSHHAAPPDVFYPVHFDQREFLRDPGVTLEDLITPRTCVVHLWNEAQRKQASPPPGSPLGKIMLSSGEEGMQPERMTYDSEG